MKDLSKLSSLARRCGAVEGERLEVIELPVSGPVAISTKDQEAARDRLELRRTGSVYYINPNKQKRDIFRSKKTKEKLNDRSSWTFTKAERFNELNELIRNGGDISVAQAILAFEANDPIDINKSYVSDENGLAQVVQRPNNWLKTAAARNDSKFVQLLCSNGADQPIKDEALITALQNSAMGAVKALLEYKASVNGPAGAFFLSAIADRNDDLVRTFLSAPIALDQRLLDEALVRVTGTDNGDTLALLLAHDANPSAYDALCVMNAVNGGYLEDVATILLHVQDQLDLRTVNAATSSACGLAMDSTRQSLIHLFLCLGADPNLPELQDQLLAAVDAGDAEFTKLLIEYGTSPERNNAETLRHAISRGRIDLISILLRHPISEVNASKLLDETAAFDSSEDFEDVVEKLLEIPISHDALDRCLANAVQKSCRPDLLKRLIVTGSTLEYDNALCVRTALVNRRLDVLSILMSGQCSPQTLCKAIPVAISIEDPADRLLAVTTLLNKGVSGKELHTSLRDKAATISSSSDYELMGLLIKHNASVDYKDDQGNCLGIAAKAVDERAVDVLDQGNPNADTASAALAEMPLGFSMDDLMAYEKTIRVLDRLLHRDAHGLPLAKTFLQAVRDDGRGKAFALLLNRKPDANYRGGATISAALLRQDTDYLGQICECLPLSRETFVEQLPNALKPETFTFNKFSTLVHATQKYQYPGILDHPLLQEVRMFGRRENAIKLLLKLGASVDYRDGEALYQTVSENDVYNTRLLLSVQPRTSTVARSFPATMKIEDLGTRFAMMEALLAAGGPGMGDEALVQAAREANSDDLSHVDMLLRHKASIDYKDGAALVEAVRTSQLTLLDRLLEAHPNERSLANAFDAARNVDCPRNIRHEIFARLLGPGAKTCAISQALVETLGRDATDMETSKLLLNHGASVDHGTGQAMQIVSAAASIDLLTELLSHNPKPRSRNASFQAATNSTLDSQSLRKVYTILSDAGVSQGMLSQGLITASNKSQLDTELLHDLLRYGALLDFNDGQALSIIATRHELAALKLLLTASVQHSATLNRAFCGAMIARDDKQEEIREEVVRELLQKEPGVSKTTVSYFVAQAVREQDHSLLKLLKSQEPDLTVNDGEAMVLAATLGDSTALALLTEGEVTKQTANRAFESMLNERVIHKMPRGLASAALLLGCGIEQHLIDRCLLDAFDEPIDDITASLVRLLIPHQPDFSGGQGKVYVAAAHQGQTALFDLMAMQCPDLDVVIKSMITAFQNVQDELGSHPEQVCVGNPETSVEMHAAKIAETGELNLVDGTADKEPGGHDGEHVSADPRHGADILNTDPEDYLSRNNAPPADDNDTSLLSQSNQNSISFDLEAPESTYGDVSAIANAMTSEEKLVFYLQHLDQHSQRAGGSLGYSVIFRAIEAFPSGRLLTKHLLDHGCSPASKIEATVDPFGDILHISTSDREEMTVLIWALGMQEPEVDEDVVLEILSRDEAAEPKFLTQTSLISAVALASAKGHVLALQKLIDLGVNISRKDALEHSPSFYASRNGRKEAIELLHQHKCKLDDGSLHEAARQAHYEVVECLLTHSHRTDYPSPLHMYGTFGLTALEELCLRARNDWQTFPIEVSSGHDVAGREVNHTTLPNDDGAEEVSDESWEECIQKCMKALLPSKGTSVSKTDGRTMLHMAMHNPDVIPVLTCLLDFQEVWEFLNHETHRYKDEYGFFYSPTVYFSTFCTSGTSEEVRNGVIALLKAKKCEDRFYAHTVTQPKGAVGLPNDIALAVEKQERADFEHAEAIKRQNDLTARKRAQEAEDYHRRLASDKDRHDRLMTQQAEHDARERAITSERQSTALRHAEKLANERQKAADEENRTRLQALTEEARQRQTIQSRKQAAELDHKRDLARQELAALKQKLQLEEQIAEQKLSGAQETAEIERKILKQRRETADYEARQRQAYNNSGY